MSLENGVKRTNIYLQHGWGFDAECWRLLLPYCCKCSVTLADRGYLGGSLVVDNYQEPALNITVSHSLGLHFLNDELLERTNLLVIIGGFQAFHGERPADGRFSRRHVAKMLTDLLGDPMALLERFYRDCSYPHWKLDVKSLDTELLYNDLLFLDRHSLDLTKLMGIDKIVVLHGLKDRIVPKERGVCLADSLANAKFMSLADAGHGLIFTHPEWCWQIILENSE